MTQEEKAKAYDEALTTAKRIISENCSEVEKLCLKCVFPELVESEDERIRKRLIEYFEGFRMGNAEVKWEGLTVQEVLAYLEKQKEPVVNKEGMYYYLGGKFIYCGYPAIEGNPYDFAMNQQEKQKEQKEETLRDFIDDFPYSDEQKEQKPAEWSEEDDKPIDRDLSDIDDDFQGLNSEAICRSYKGDCINCPHNRIKIKNKSLQSNLEWRHYIWATNLRFDFTALIKYDNTDNYEIVQAGNRPKQEKNGVYILIKDIKPQPSWRPSEEQMESLAYAIQVLNSNPHPKSAKAYQDLQTLYKNIKYGN